MRCQTKTGLDSLVSRVRGPVTRVWVRFELSVDRGDISFVLIGLGDYFHLVYHYDPLLNNARLFTIRRRKRVLEDSNDQRFTRSSCFALARTCSAREDKSLCTITHLCFWCKFLFSDMTIKLDAGSLVFVPLGILNLKNMRLLGAWEDHDRLISLLISYENLNSLCTTFLL